MGKRPQSKSTADITATDPVAQHKADIIAKQRAHKRGAANASKAHKQGLQENRKAHKAKYAKPFVAQPPKVTGGIPAGTVGGLAGMPGANASTAGVTMGAQVPKPTGLDGKPLKKPKSVEPKKLEGVLNSDGHDQAVAAMEMNQQFVDSLVILAERLNVTEDQILALFDVVDNLEDKVEESLSDEKPRDQSPPEEEAANPFTNSQFYTAQKSGAALTVTVNAGKLIRGTTVTTIAASDVVISSVNGTYYVYLESWYNVTYKQQYASSTGYPTQAVINDGGTDFPCERTLIATVTIASNVISTVYPERVGEIHSSRMWP